MSLFMRLTSASMAPLRLLWAVISGAFCNIEPFCCEFKMTYDCVTLSIIPLLRGDVFVAVK